MGYFLMEEDLAYGCSINEFPKLAPNTSFLAGEWLDLPMEQPLEFGVTCSANDEPNHFFNTNIPVFSAAMVEQFRLAGADNFQVFPAILVNREERVRWDNYFALNILGLIDAASEDESSSTAIMPGDTLDGVPPFVHYDRLVIDPERVKGALMFRELKAPEEIIFDDKVKQYLKANSPKGGWKVGLRIVESATV